MRLAFTRDFPLNTRLIAAPTDGDMPVYVVRTPLLSRRWTTTVIRWEGGILRRAGQIAWGVRRPSKLWIGTQEWMLDDFLRKPRWYKGQWTFDIGTRKFLWQDSMLPFARVKLMEVETGAVVACLTHPFLGTPTLSVDEAIVDPQALDVVVITAVIIEYWRLLRRT